MLALDVLRVSFAWARHVGFQMPGICAPMIGIKARETNGFQQRFPLQKDLILTTPEDIGQDRTRGVIDRMPPPPRRFLLTDKTPHCINLSFPRTLNSHRHLLGVYGAEQGRV